jgi:uncharacterized protein with PIN domain
MGRSRVLDNNTQIRASEILCESEDIKIQCTTCKSPLIKVDVPMESIRHAVTQMMYCKQCDAYYIGWDTNDET